MKPTKRFKNTVKALENLAVDAAKPDNVAPFGRANQYGLTEKQEDFARYVANGSTLSDAYRNSYDVSNMSTSSVYTAASQLIDNTKVASRVKTLMEIREKKTHAIDAMRIRQHVFDRLMIESVMDESPAASRIKALELLGRIDLVSMFKESKGPLEDKEDVGEITAKLQAMLGKLIDVTPKG